MENQEKVHKRRVRYSGTHPKSYKEKYKEHNPEKYADTIAKVIQKGSTPAGMHISIMVQEILDFLQIKPGMTGLDATLGYGGHTKAMLQKLEGNGHIYALDVDPIESAKTKERLASQGFGEDILTVRLQNFADIDQVTKDTGKKFDFILADLGVSSMQIDNPERGFSYKVDGPLDLRMNPQKGESAAERLAEVTYEELVGMLKELSGDFEGKFWIEQQDLAFEFITHIYLKENMDKQTKRKFINVSTDKKNAAAKGIIGKIRDVVENMLYPENAVYSSNFISYQLETAVLLDDQWTLKRYKDAEKNNKEPWDELEKSIIANLADDVSVAVRGNNVEIVITKNFK